MEALMLRLRENKTKYQCYEAFIEGNPFLGYVQEGNAFLFRGDSDGPWVYFVADSPEEFKALLSHLTPMDKQFALVEDYMMPDLICRGEIANDMRCMRLVLPDHVMIDHEVPDGVVIRPLMVADVPYMYANYIYADSASSAYFEMRVKQGVSFGVEVQGQLVGWVLTHDDGALGMLHVMEAFRGHGYADVLTRHLCLALRAKGILPHLAIKLENFASMGLARKIGFVEDRVIHWLQMK
jgi:8-oxo-dGTP diphosphatase